MTIIIKKPVKNKFQNYFHNIDWKKATSFEMFHYVKMMEYHMLLEACVYFNNIWQKHFKKEKERFKEKIVIANKLQYLLDEAVERRAIRMKLTPIQYKQKYKKLRQDLDYFLKTKETLSHGNKS